MTLRLSLMLLASGLVAGCTTSSRSTYVPVTSFNAELKTYAEPATKMRTAALLRWLEEDCLSRTAGSLYPSDGGYHPRDTSLPVRTLPYPSPLILETGRTSEAFNTRAHVLAAKFVPSPNAPDWMGSPDLPGAGCSLGMDGVDPRAVVRGLASRLSTVATVSVRSGMSERGVTYDWYLRLPPGAPGYVQVTTPIFYEYHPAGSTIVRPAYANARVNMRFTVPPDVPRDQTILAMLQNAARNVSSAERASITADAQRLQAALQSRTNAANRQAALEQQARLEEARARRIAAQEAGRRASGTTDAQIFARGVSQGLASQARQQADFEAIRRKTQPTALERAMDAPRRPPRDRDGKGKDANGSALSLTACEWIVIDPPSDLRGRMQPLRTDSCRSTRAEAQNRMNSAVTEFRKNEAIRKAAEERAERERQRRLSEGNRPVPSKCSPTAQTCEK